MAGATGGASTKDRDPTTAFGFHYRLQITPKVYRVPWVAGVCFCQLSRSSAVSRGYWPVWLGVYLDVINTDSSVGKESACNAGDPRLIPGSGRPPGEGIGYLLQYSWASLVAQLVKNLLAMRETWIQSPGSWARLPTPVFWPGEFHGLYSPWGRKELDMTE